MGTDASINGGTTAAAFFIIVCNGKWISNALSYDTAINRPNNVVSDNANSPNVKTARKPDVIFDGGSSKMKI